MRSMVSARIASGACEQHDETQGCEDKWLLCIDIDLENDTSNALCRLFQERLLERQHNKQVADWDTQTN